MLSTKAPPSVVVHDWTGFYLGGHLGYAGGQSDWPSPSGPSGALDLYNSYDAFKGTGSYFLGLGYQITGS